VQEHLVFISSSVNHFVTWSVSKFAAHNNVPVDRIASVAFNTDTNTIAIAFHTVNTVSPRATGSPKTVRGIFGRTTAGWLALAPSVIVDLGTGCPVYATVHGRRPSVSRRRSSRSDVIKMPRKPQNQTKFSFVLGVVSTASKLLECLYSVWSASAFFKLNLM